MIVHDLQGLAKQTLRNLTLATGLLFFFPAPRVFDAWSLGWLSGRQGCVLSNALALPWATPRLQPLDGSERLMAWDILGWQWILCPLAETMVLVSHFSLVDSRDCLGGDALLG